MAYTVYILQNNQTKRYYVGSTSDVVRRLGEHNRGQTRSTSSDGEWSVVYTELFSTKREATQRERMIKSYKGGNAFKRLLSRE